MLNFRYEFHSRRQHSGSFSCCPFIFVSRNSLCLFVFFFWCLSFKGRSQITLGAFYKLLEICMFCSLCFCIVFVSLFYVIDVKSLISISILHCKGCNIITSKSSFFLLTQISTDEKFGFVHSNNTILWRLVLILKCSV